MEKQLKKEYTEEQYRKDKKKLIGVGYLIMAIIVAGLFFWNLGRMEERKIEREKIVKKEIDQSIIPDFRKMQTEITEKVLEMFKEKKKLDKITYETKPFKNFSIEISSQWTEAEIKELPEAILYDFPIIDEALFLAHDFCLRRMVLKQLKGGEMHMEGLFNILAAPEIQKIQDEDITIFAVLRIKEEADIKQKIEQLAEKRDDFKIKEIKSENINEDRVKIRGHYYWLTGDPQLPKIEFYSYKKIKKINGNTYVFLFSSNTPLENNKEVDKILDRVIIK